MANLHKISVQEALNVTVGGGWSVQDPDNAPSNASAGNTEHESLATMTSTLGVYSAVEIYFSFTTSETNCDASHDLILPKNTLTFLTVPRGLGNTVIFNYLSTSTTTGAIRIVEI